MSKDPKAKSQKTEIPEGFVVLHAPDGCTGCSFEGTEYDADNDTVTVPAEAVSQLLSHGFTTSKESK